MKTRSKKKEVRKTLLVALFCSFMMWVAFVPDNTGAAAPLTFSVATTSCNYELHSGTIRSSEVLQQDITLTVSYVAGKQQIPIFQMVLPAGGDSYSISPGDIALINNLRASDQGITEYYETDSGEVTWTVDQSDCVATAPPPVPHTLTGEVSANCNGAILSGFVTITPPLAVDAELTLTMGSNERGVPVSMTVIPANTEHYDFGGAELSGISNALVNDPGLQVFTAHVLPQGTVAGTGFELERVSTDVGCPTPIPADPGISVDVTPPFVHPPLADPLPTMPPVPIGGLPNTGTDHSGELGIAFAASAAGAVLVFVSRRPRSA